MSQRKRLLRRFDVILVNPKSSLSQLIDAICAFCIVTSSSSTDAIRHFHDLRLDEIRRLSDESEKGLDGALAGFDYYLQSLRTTTKLLGREFSDAVRDLRSKPLLQSSDIQSLEDLDIATTRQFIPPEILNFVPWIKQPNGRGDEAASVLKKWSNVAFEEVCLRLKSTIEVIPNTSELLKFRAQMLQIWLPVSFSSSTHSNSGVFEALRTIFNTRLEHLLRAKAGSLCAIASEVEAALRRGNESFLLSSLPIWDHDFVTSSLGKGAVSYKKQLMDRHLCQSKPTKSILTSLQHWTAAMSNSLENIKQLRTTRWNDFIEEDDDDEDEEEKDRTEQTVRILQKDDPDLYEQEHNSSLRNATHDFQEQIKKAAESLTSTETSKAIFLLRTIRAIHSHLSTFSLQQQQQQQDLTILASSVPPLHYLLAKTTASTLLLSHLKPSSLRPSMHKLKAATHLWAGNPSLPTHPSPPIFKLLQHLTTIMADHGPDIWCAEAVTAVKRAIKKSLAERKLLHHSLSGPLSIKRQKRISVNGTRNVKHTDGETEQETETETQLLTTQTIFDFLYLSYALHVPEDDGGDGDDEAEPSVPAQRPDHPHAAALDARAKDYWGRTSALFALLA
jgi:conserved oligomeric Golgi complex subunit 1